MRNFITSLFCTIALVAVLMQLQPSAVGTPVSAPPAAVTAPDKPAESAPVQYETVKVCDGNSCHYERRPVASAVKKLTGRAGCDCGCGCDNCNCGYQPVQQAAATNQRRGLFGRGLLGRGLFGRLRGCCR